MTAVELNLPKMLATRNYHELRNIDSLLRKLNPGLRCREVGLVGFDGTEYVGVIYFGAQLTKAELQVLAKKEGISLQVYEDIQ